MMQKGFFDSVEIRSSEFTEYCRVNGQYVAMSPAQAALHFAALGYKVKIVS